MRILTLAALAVASVTASALPATSLASGKLKGLDRAAALRAPEESSAPVWRAEVQHIYSYYGSWVHSEDYQTKYDSRGNMIERVTAELGSNGQPRSYVRVTCEYGNDNSYYTRRLTEISQDGINWEPSRLIEREYDERMPGIITVNTEYMWQGGNWARVGNCYTRTITRNDDGNVTEVTIAVLYMGEYDPTERLVVTYGSDGLPTELTQYMLTTDNKGGFVWVEGAHYANVKWDTFDGQLVSIDRLPSDGNHIKSAAVKIQEGVYAQVSYTYPDDNGSFVSVARAVYSGTPVTTTMTYTVVDEWGSYDYSVMESVSMGQVSIVNGSSEQYRVDAYGLETLVYVTVTEDGEEFVASHAIGDVVYNAEYGYPESYVLSEVDPESGDVNYLAKIEYEDYVNVAGVENVTVDANENTVPEFFDLNGVRFNSLPSAPGVYIVRRGTAARKLIVH
ncbi:MAG: hypothetical protein K2M00_01720 [Muribaculaceae bacterium]|nr:hypothetical protein [Muribaculaceae bacterium]